MVSKCVLHAYMWEQLTSNKNKNVGVGFNHYSFRTLSKLLNVYLLLLDSKSTITSAILKNKYSKRFFRFH